MFKLKNLKIKCWFNIMLSYNEIVLNNINLDGLKKIKRIDTTNLTVDIDIAYSYRGKGIKRTLGGLTRSLLFSEFDEAKERIRALFYKGADPYDTYDYIFQVCDENNLQPLIS